MNEDEHRELFDQLADEQTQAGLAHIAKTAADFRDRLLERGFTEGQAFKLARDMLLCLMDSVAFGGGDDE